MKKEVVAVLVLAVLALSACQGTRQPTTPELTKLRIGELPIVDVLPIYVAQQEGLFAEEGVEVEIVPFNSAAEMNAALDANQIDGEVDSIIAAALTNKLEPNVRIVRIAGQSSSETMMFAILASSQNDIESPAELRGRQIAISENTIIEYVTTRLLESQGLSSDDVEFMPVPKMPMRLEALSQGRVDAATLSEPLVSLAVSDGARMIIDDRGGDFSLGVLILRDEVLQNSPEAVRGFLRAYERAVQMIDEHPDQYKPLLASLGRIPVEVQEQYEAPPFPYASVPTENQVQDVVNWMLAKGLIDRNPRYDELVDPSFLP